MKKVSSFVTAAAFVVALACSSAGTGGGDASPSAGGRSPAGMAPEAVAAGFVEAFGAFDGDRAATYLDEDADISDLVGSLGGGALGTPDELSLMIGYLEGAGYEQILHGCRKGTSVAGAIIVTCQFDFHMIRSSQIGNGPYAGSYFDLTFVDGRIVRASMQWETAEFSPEMWEPFAEWVSEEHPKDVAIMYGDRTMTGVRLSPESVDLWERNSRAYARYVNGRTADG